MCRVYNIIGCLTTIKEHLDVHNIHEYHSISELIKFQKEYDVTRQQIIAHHQTIIEQEKNALSIEVAQLDDSIKTRKIAVEQQLIFDRENLEQRLIDLLVIHPSIIQLIVGFIKKTWLKLKILFSQITFDFKIAYSIKNIVAEYNKKNFRYKFIITSPEGAVMQSCSAQLRELDRKKNVVDQINNSIYGALGEQQVVRELEKLGDDFILINDFKCYFNPAIYDKRQNDSIRSVQIDHILITPSGVFLIETKNWSRESVNNANLYSPVQQIKRASFALYRILNGKSSDSKLALKRHHWGDRKIPIKNLIVLINYKPTEEFEHVKISTLNGLLGYINYFKPCFSDEETQIIAAHLLGISGNNSDL
jgi:hypothetical protein